MNAQSRIIVKRFGFKRTAALQCVVIVLKVDCICRGVGINNHVGDALVIRTAADIQRTDCGVGIDVNRAGAGENTRATDIEDAYFSAAIEGKLGLVLAKVDCTQ